VQKRILVASATVVYIAQTVRSVSLALTGQTDGLKSIEVEYEDRYLHRYGDNRNGG
jgi:hypothetical protein